MATAGSSWPRPGSTGFTRLTDGAGSSKVVEVMVLLEEELNSFVVVAAPEAAIDQNSGLWATEIEEGTDDNGLHQVGDDLVSFHLVERDAVTKQRPKGRLLGLLGGLVFKEGLRVLLAEEAVPRLSGTEESGDPGPS